MIHVPLKFRFLYGCRSSFKLWRGQNNKVGLEDLGLNNWGKTFKHHPSSRFKKLVDDWPNSFPTTLLSLFICILYIYIHIALFSISLSECSVPFEDEIQDIFIILGHIHFLRHIQILTDITFISKQYITLFLPPIYLSAIFLPEYPLPSFTIDISHERLVVWNFPFQICDWWVEICGKCHWGEFCGGVWSKKTVYGVTFKVLFFPVHSFVFGVDYWVFCSSFGNLGLQ